MNKFKWYAITLVIQLILFAAFLGYMGVFNTLQVTEQQLGPHTYVYEKFVGPYSDVGTVFKKVEAALKADGITPEKGIGIYYDNPDKVAKEKLRSDCGFVLKESDLAKVPELKKKYAVAVMPRKMAMSVEFPKKNTLSYMLGPIKSYPVLMKYAQEKGYKITTPYELYLEDRTLFVMEIVK